MGTITTADYRNRRVFGSEPRRTVKRMAHHDNVRISFQHPDGIGNGFALGSRRGHLRLGMGHHCTAESVHRCFKRASGAGAGLIEYGVELLPLAKIQSLTLLNGRAHLIGQVQNRLYLLVGEVVNGDQVPSGKCHLRPPPGEDYNKPIPRTQRHGSRFRGSRLVRGETLNLGTLKPVTEPHRRGQGRPRLRRQRVIF